MQPFPNGVYYSGRGNIPTRSIWDLRKMIARAHKYVQTGVLRIEIRWGFRDKTGAPDLTPQSPLVSYINGAIYWYARLVHFRRLPV